MVAILSGKNPTGVMIFFPSPNTPPAQGGAVVGAAGVDGVHVRHQNLAENTFKADADIWDGRASPLWSNGKFTQNCAKNKYQCIIPHQNVLLHILLKTLSNLDMVYKY